MKKSILLGVYLYGALYIAGVFAAGLVLGRHGAMYLSLATAGFAYLSQICAYASDWGNDDAEQAHGLLWLVTLGFGVASGFTLLGGW